MRGSLDLEALAEQFERSAAQFPDAGSAFAAYGCTWDENVPCAERAVARIRQLIVSQQRTDLDTHDLRRAQRAFLVREAIGAGCSWCAELNAVLFGIEAGSYLRPITDPAWREAVDLARALIAIDEARLPLDERDVAVAKSARRLAERGFRLTPHTEGIRLAEGEVERATATIQGHLDALGVLAVLENLFRAIRDRGDLARGLYFPGRRTGRGRESAAIPFGFLVNLAVRSPVSSPPSDAPRRWLDALELARDLVACLDVEPYDQLFAISVHEKWIVPFLGEVGQFDHLFRLRQWPASITPIVLREFFRPIEQSTMRDALGWDIGDAVLLSEVVDRLAQTDPAVIRTSDLVNQGLDQQVVERMLPSFVHPPGRANLSYLSPLAAADGPKNGPDSLMFKPLVEIAPGSFTPVASSICGPAFYEAVQKAVRGLLSKTAIDELVGQGAERVIGQLFGDAGIRSSHVAAKYDMGAGNQGECDLVFEDDECVLLVEVKGKALTRATMAGASGAALLDIAGGLLAAQVQLLRHQRILRSEQRIDFVDGSTLRLAGRRIVKLSATLLDLGSLQDRMLFKLLLPGLLAVRFTPAALVGQARQVNDLNSVLDDALFEVGELAKLGLSVDQVTFPCASLNAGQLAYLLEGAADLQAFVTRVTVPLTMMTLDPIAEDVLIRGLGAGRNGP